MKEQVKKASQMDEGYAISQENQVNLNHRNDFPFLIEASKDNSNLTEYVSSNKEKVDALVCQHGAILFRNFNINTVAKFENLNMMLSKLFDAESLEYAFRSSPRYAVGKNVYTSTSYPKEYSINMHSEASYMPNGHPQYIIFCCINPPSEKGETPIADNRLVLKYLSEETKNKFKEKGVQYVRNLNKDIGLSWEEVFQTTDKSQVEAECNRVGMQFHWKNQDNLELTWIKKAIWEHPKTQASVWFSHASFFNKFTLENDYYEVIDNKDKLPNDTYYGDGSEINRDEIKEILAAYQQATVQFPWQKGDVLFLDNMLSSHGRNPYEGKRKIITSLF
jgi:alpha-ketoglutarate-dependent taurine dioxygenase